MAVTRLKRKGQKNKLTSRTRLSTIKLLTATPIIKNVDVEAIKAGFEKDSASKPAAKAAKAPKKDAAEAPEAKTTAVKQEEPLKNHPTDKE